MKISNKKEIRIDFIIIIGMILLFIPIIVFFKANFLTSTILFFAAPAAYLFDRKPKQKKRLIASVFAGMIVAFSVDLLAEVNGAWSWAPHGQLVFPNKIFGLVPIDVLIWYFFWVIFTIVYYEHFFEVEKSKIVSPKFRKATYFFSVILLAILTIAYIDIEIVKFRYAYLYIGLTGSMPFFYIIIKRPGLAFKFFKAAVFSIFLFFSFEITALMLDQWRFQGEYIGTVQLFGQVFPFEELIFWIILGTPVILSYYELFIDDGK